MKIVYSMPEKFMSDTSVPVKWRLYGIINGYWLNGLTVYAANKHFAERLKCAERTIRYALEELETEKLLTRIINGHNRVIRPYGIVQEEATPLPPGGNPVAAATATPLPPNASSIASSSIGGTKVPQGVYILEGKEDTEREPKAKAKYPHAKLVFSWFPKPQASWTINTTELKHAELLFEKGEEAIRGALEYVSKHKDDDFLPKIIKPSDLERKWLDLQNYAERN